MRWVEGWQAKRLRDALAAAMAGEARAMAAPALPAGMEERVWAGVLGRIGTNEGVGARAAKAAHVAVGPRAWAAFGATLALAAAAALYVLVSPATLPTDGIKSGSAAIDPQLKSLRFALVDTAGKVTPGIDKMRLAPGTPLIFSVEAAHVGAAGHPVVLTYRLGDGPATTVADYRLTSDRETLRGPSGYLAFTPNEPGIYRFRLEPKNPSVTEPSDHVDFSVEVARP